ncbi:MAG TPA: altronate dehydrogenase [Gemmataceae bacterium]|nr:altronate dehydrogenase [Gemmataceae bacterium]
MTTLCETILQFGAGRFLRAFADLFIHQANEEGQNVGRIVIVQSTGDERAAALNRQHGRYHVAVRGYESGAVVDRLETSASISRALVASSQWEEIRAVARSPELRIILSNTTESGYNLDPADTDRRDAGLPAPRSFPAKLLAVLRERFEAGQPPLTIVPCELREHNADTLRRLLLQLAHAWQMPDAFTGWLEHECVWLNTLVDRIVVDPPADHPLRAEDAMLAVCEPYALWAIQMRSQAEPGNESWHFIRHPAVVWTPDVQPYFLRKVRILNGAHTALLIKAWPRGFKTVRDAVNDAELGPWLERLLFEEIVPVLEGRVEGPEQFARQVLDRFRNPFFEHQLASIAAHHADKVQVRLVPTLDELKAKLGRTPPLLQEVLSMPPPSVAT